MITSLTFMLMKALHVIYTSRGSSTQKHYLMSPHVINTHPHASRLMMSERGRGCTICSYIHEWPNNNVSRVRHVTRVQHDA
jgi:hypothetical protein